MEPHHIKLVKDSFEKAAVTETAALALFNDDFPEIRETSCTDTQDQRVRALKLIRRAVMLLDSPDEVSTQIIMLASEAQIAGDDYDYASNAYLRAVRKALGREFTADVWSAWVEALCTFADILAKISPVRQTHTHASAY